MKVAFAFIFSRKSLFEIKCLPCCPFSLWAYSSVKCHCDCRLGVFNLLIDDWIKFQSYDNDFDPIEANRQFIRLLFLIEMCDRDVLFQNPDENPEDLLERLNRRFSGVH